MLPNFIIVGAPKAGTTSLCHYLSEHPLVFMSDPKEINFFSKEEIENQGVYCKEFKAKNIAEYEDLFASVTDEKAVGEGSVSYLFYPKVAQKIKDALPNVKIVILLRDPISRGFSHYLMDYRLGLVNVPYDEIVNKKSSHKNGDLYYQQYVELGLYYKQVKRYLDYFGRKQVKVYLQEDLCRDIKGVLLDLYDFFGINKSFLPNADKQHNAFLMPKNRLIHKLYSFYMIRNFLSELLPNWLKEILLSTFFERSKKPELSESTREYLRKFYLPDIQKLEILIHRDLSHWYGE